MRAPLPTALFALFAAGPLVLLALGVWLGGAWSLAAFAWMGFATAALDVLIPLCAPDAPPQAEFPGSEPLLLALGLVPLFGLPAVTFALAHGPFGPPQVLVILACGLWLGQVAHPAAHELIHRPGRLPRAIGVAAYVALLMGHHASAHRLVHHTHVGTPADPNTARAGQGFWSFAPRAWAGSFRAAWRAEAARRSPAFALYLGGALAALALAAALGGIRAMALWLVLAALAQTQILLSDYVQHYGLTRARLPGGRLEPVGPRHSWNAGHWASSALTLNATRHSDHHCHPLRPYPTLALPPQAPRLPWPLPVAACVALYPPLWHRRMKPRLKAPES